MAVTPLSLRTTYPWLAPAAPTALEYPSATELATATAAWTAEITSLDAALQSLIDAFTPLFDAEVYGDCFDLALGLYIAHFKHMENQECLRVAASMKIIEQGLTIHVDQNLRTQCGCDDDGYLGLSIYGQQLLQIQEENIAGIGFYVMGCL